MMDPTRASLLELDAAYATGAARPSAVVGAHLERIAALDPALNAYAAVFAEAAIAEAEAADRRQAAGERRGPLDGVPVAIKDNIDVAGRITGNGLGARAGAAAAGEDAPCLARLRAAGAVLLGVLNMHEGALGGTTDNPHRGPTQNPWRAGHTPGGSSGGSAAAVAAGLATASLGTDTMGSVRLPAAYCGLFALKPTQGLISPRGVAPLSWSLDTVGPLARGLADLGPLLAVLAGPDPREPGSANRGLDRAPSGVALARLRIATLCNFDEAPAEPAVRAVCDDALDRIAAAGARIVEAEIPGYRPTRARLAGLWISEAEGAVASAADRLAHPDAYSPYFHKMLDYGAALPGARLAEAYRSLRDIGHAARRLLGRVDLIVAPTTPHTAFAFAAEAPVSQADFTALANFAGAPSLSLPVGLDGDGLPIGLQLVAAPGRDNWLLAAAEAAMAVLPPPPALPA